jgi:ubiquinone/menaquinone biosynthesis C-methylase UbiE
MIRQAMSSTDVLNPFKVFERIGLRRGAWVADLGCGSTGHFVFPAAQMVGADGKVFALDIRKVALQAIEKAARHEHFWNIETVWSDIEVAGAARIPDASLDLTLVVDNLYMADNRDGLIQEAWRVTKPGGAVLCIEWAPGKTLIGPADDRRLSQTDADELWQRHGWVSRDAFEPGEFHYALLYQRLMGEPFVTVGHVALPTTH